MSGKWPITAEKILYQGGAERQVDPGATKESVFSKQHGGLSGEREVRRRKVLHFLNQGYHFREAYATQLLATRALTRFKHSCTLSRRGR